MCTTSFPLNGDASLYPFVICFGEFVSSLLTSPYRISILISLVHLLLQNSYLHPCLLMMAKLRKLTNNLVSIWC